MISRQHSQENTSWAGMRVIQKDTSHKPAAYIEAFLKCVSLSSSDSLSHAARWPRLLTGHTKAWNMEDLQYVCDATPKKVRAFVTWCKSTAWHLFPHSFSFQSESSTCCPPSWDTDQRPSLSFRRNLLHIKRPLSLLLFLISRLTNHESLGI